MPAQADTIQKPAKKAAPRNLALDFTKGVLVLFMVLYHWLNYFVGHTGIGFRYLRFITPSFILIAGFLVTNIYLTKYDPGDARLRRRLFIRGVKLLIIFAVLNVMTDLEEAHGHFSLAMANGRFLNNAAAAFLVGTGKNGVKVCDFGVLAPISYVLIVSAALTFCGQFYKRSAVVLCAAICATAWILEATDHANTNLSLFSAGFLGMVLGCAPIRVIDRAAQFLMLIVGLYCIYLGVIWYWDVTYPIQILGVCLSLMLIYAVGAKTGLDGRMGGVILLLGRYSLLSYIMQIFVLQVMRRIVNYLEFEPASVPVRVISFALAFGLTTAIMALVDIARKKSNAADKMYTAVFA